MPPQEIIDYIKENIQIGTPRETIVNNLLSADWTQDQIDAAFSFVTLNLHVGTVNKTNTTSWLSTLVFLFALLLIGFGICASTFSL